ncbi:YeeE/YedE family protein [Natroniella sulfidigena]|uniref:YeeE/YedE thiosulfate transporter family protein n=1 Tax=Natroniella sulfidigena TaxID=723921 RepID=UPI00200B368C|nr:YeeE/YedE thiosulfate transporter family protein [Natroniella sulfidigena]MCK8816097.1 YeeE/YedE family protein [Natroniella sulfidigena]
MDRSSKKVLFNHWPYWLGALLLACLNIVILIYTGRPWGIAGAFVIDNFNYDKLILNLGIITGSFLSTLLAGQFRLRQVCKLKRGVYLLLGGFLMGYGLRIVGGCNIGVMVNETASLSIHGLIFFGSVCIGAYLGSKIIKKLLL